MGQAGLRDEPRAHSQTEHKPWDRLPGESSKAFDAFTKYRGLAAERTYQRVAEVSHCNASNIRRWAGRWDWPARVREWDVYEDQVRQEAQIRERLKMAERQAKTGMEMQDLAAMQLSKLRLALESDDPKLRRSLSANEIAKLMEIGSKLERSARGEPNEHVVPRIEVIYEDYKDPEEPKA